MEKQQIKFIESNSIKECEDNINNWIKQLPFLSTVLTINVLPLLIENKIVYLGVVTYSREISYSNVGGDIC